MSAGIIFGNVLSMVVFDITFNAASVAANTTAEQSVTVPGVRPGDFVHVNKQTHDAGLSCVGCRVTAADTVAVQFANNTASPIDAAAAVYRFTILRPEVPFSTTAAL